MHRFDNFFADNVNCSVKITSEQYGANDVQVSVKLARRKYMTCNVSIYPHVPMNFTGSTSFHVTLLYNTKYNLSVEGKALCRENRTTHMELHYGEHFIREPIDIDCNGLCSQLWLSIAIY